MKLPLYHNSGYSACSGLGCYYIEQEFVKGTKIQAKDIELLNGSNPEPNSILTCGNCGRYMEINLDCYYKYNE